MASSASTVTVSAPGKILLAGGYLVLESPNVGLVIAVDKRFYTTARVERREASSPSTSTSAPSISIVVESPQFDQTWRYSYTNNDLIASYENSSTNSFVEKTLRVSLLYLQPLLLDDSVAVLRLVIRADNDFYSLRPHLTARGLPPTLESVQQLPRFLHAANEHGTILKTGLGSSACLVTSLVGAVVHALAPAKAPSIANLAQVCHCYAQGKIGSGFDVSSACHGSHVYQRFPKATLDALLEALEVRPEPSHLQNMLQSVVDQTWAGGVVEPIRIPQLLQVMLADVSGGSESPSMAKQVLAWKASSDDISAWTSLQQVNQEIVRLFATLVSVAVDEDEVVALSRRTTSEWRESKSLTASLLGDLAQALVDSRRHLKAMGEAAGVPIEPESQTRLASATSALPGVVGTLVPGAGGYDAVACVCINQERVKSSIADLWAQWTELRVCPLSVQAIDYGDGVRVEPQVPSS